MYEEYDSILLVLRLAPAAFFTALTALFFPVDAGVLAILENY
jgi:hypothetical protein